MKKKNINKIVNIVLEKINESNSDVNYIYIPSKFEEDIKINDKYYTIGNETKYNYNITGLPENKE